MDEKELEQAVKKLLVEACSSRRVLEPGIDLLESGLLDSLGLITLLDGLRIWASKSSPPRWTAAAFAASKGFCSCAGRQRNPLRQPNALGNLSWHIIPSFFHFLDNTLGKIFL